MPEDRAHDRPDLVLARDVQLLEARLRLLVGLDGDEVAPELADEEPRVCGVRAVQPVSARACSRTSSSVYPLPAPSEKSSIISRPKFSFGASRSFSIPERYRSIAGSTVTRSKSEWNEPSEWRRKSAFWRSISRWEPTPSFEVANQSCHTSVIRSTSGRFVRTIRSSHQRWSCPHWSAGASGRPFWSRGGLPTRRSARG
jgi:hypothetical protein